MKMKPTRGLASPSTIRSICGQHVLRLLALTINSGKEHYHVEVKSSSSEWHPGTLHHESGDKWTLTGQSQATIKPLHIAAPDSVFATAIGGSHELRQQRVRDALPHWPDAHTDRLAKYGIFGDGTVAFSASTFLSMVATMPMDRPLVFPNAASKLGFGGIPRLHNLIASIATMRASGDASSPQSFAQQMVSISDEAASGHILAPEAWAGRGRLIGMWPDGELAQIGADVVEGARMAVGHGVVRATFPPDKPLGLGLGPLCLGEGRGAEVGEVDAESEAERQGVVESMVLLSIEDSVAGSSRSLDNGHDLSDVSQLPFAEVLRAIDERRDAGMEVTITFDTASPTTHLYAVEMPAVPASAAMASFAECEWTADDADVGRQIGALLENASTPPPLWQEDATKLFFGDAGSLTCAHVDIAPDLELCHGVHGTKLVGVASHGATERLLEDHASEGQDDEEVVATSVPTHRPLEEHERALLCDPEVSVACVQPEDVLVFSSAALHFASNGADGVNAALFHGIVTDAALPRLRAAASRGSHGTDDQMSAEDVLDEITSQKGPADAD